jgi:hypothetical protein
MEWYETFGDGENTLYKSHLIILSHLGLYYDKYPFLGPFIDFVCPLIWERPNDEFLRDALGYL